MIGGQTEQQKMAIGKGDTPVISLGLLKPDGLSSYQIPTENI